MIFKKMLKIFKFVLLIYLTQIFNVYSNDQNFEIWLKNFKLTAIKTGISKQVVDNVLENVKFLPKVIEYDRYQPEFYEDTFTYIEKINKKLGRD